MDQINTDKVSSQMCSDLLIWFLVEQKMTDSEFQLWVYCFVIVKCLSYRNNFDELQCSRLNLCIWFVLFGFLDSRVWLCIWVLVLTCLQQWQFQWLSSTWALFSSVLQMRAIVGILQFINKLVFYFDVKDGEFWDWMSIYFAGCCCSLSLFMWMDNQNEICPLCILLFILILITFPQIENLKMDYCFWARCGCVPLSFFLIDHCGHWFANHLQDHVFWYQLVETRNCG